jgi:hypothetical protein
VGTKRDTPGGARPADVERLITVVRDRLAQPRSDAEELIRHITALRAADWASRLRKGPRHWERFCVEHLGCPASALQQILDGAAGLRMAGLLGSTVAQAQAAAWDAGD